MKSHPSYELVGAIGQGRYATVYRARDLALNREVAIKELNDEARGDERLLQRCWEEARFLAGVEHDNVVQIYGLDQERGWIVMELAEGSLAASLAAGPLPIDSARSVLRQVLDGLDCLHHHGRTHGAVKPANLLISSAGVVKLSDTTGVAGASAADRPTKYLAPEQLDSTLGSVGPAADLYCLGFTVLELLVGPDFDALFPGVEVGPDGWRQVHASLAPLPAAATVLPGLPADLARVIDRLLQKRVADRYATAADVLKDLEDAPTVAPAKSSPLKTQVATADASVFLSPPTLRVPKPQPTPAAEPSGRETLLPTMFPVVQTPEDLRVSELAPVTVAPAARSKIKPALETVRDIQQYPRWSRLWINQKLENPRVLYPLCGSIALVTVLLLANLLFKHFGSGTTPKPEPIPVLTLRPVRITSFPAGANIYIDGELKSEKTDASFDLEPGQHQVRVELKEFVASNQVVDVPIDGPDPKPVEFTLIAKHTDTGPKHTDTGPKHTDTGQLIVPPMTSRIPPPLPPGKLLVRSSPDKATVFVDGEDKGQTPLDLELKLGEHTVRFERALFKTKQLPVTIRSGQPTSIDQPLEPLRAPGSFALLIGVREVEGLSVFRHSSSEMAELGRVLTSGGLPTANLTVLAQGFNVNPTALPTADRIRQAFKELLKDRYPDDVLLVALSGPAIIRPGDSESYFCPQGADIARPSTLIPLTAFFQQLAACPAKTKFVLIDSNRVGPSYPTRPPAANLEKLIPPGVTALLATPNGEPAPLHVESRHSVFWFFVLRGLRGAANRGAITIGALADYVREQTRQYVDKFYKIEQTPKLVAASPAALSVRLTDPDGASRFLLEGELLLEKKDYKKAIEKLSLALAERKDVLAYLYRAEAYYPSHRYAEMIEDCTAALQLDPGNAAASDLLGDAHLGNAGKPPNMNLSEVKVAIENYDAAVQADPDYAPFFQSRAVARGSMAIAYYDKKEPEKAKAEDQLAVADFCQAVNLAPRPHYLYFAMRARAYKRLEKYDRVVDDYTAALQTGETIDPEDLFLLYFNRGQAYMDIRDYKKAESDFDKAAKLDPNDPAPHRRRAKALDELGRTEEAKEERAKDVKLRGLVPARSK
jgi:serine/threonine-protein kinase